MINKDIFLGEPGDPEPVWKEEAEDAKDWPESAVFAITFRREDFAVGVSAYILAELPRTEFYGVDGWPLDLPEERKSLPAAIRQDFQVFPRAWKEWNERSWEYARDFSEMFRRSRALGGRSRAVAELTSKLALKI